MRNPQILGDNFRYQFGGAPDRPKTQKVPAPLATPETLTQQAQGAGQRERKRLRGRRGRRGTIFAGRRDLAPARTSAAELKQKMGALSPSFNLLFNRGL